MLYRRRYVILVLAAFLPAPVMAQPPETPEESDAKDDESTELSARDRALLEMLEGEVIEIVESAPPGSAHAVGEEELERFERDDIHKVLAQVPGVYVRQEDGYGLRPNIGMRGSGSERSAKIALMEDGVLIAPAPYSAPAAYYFPLVTRMSGVEVLKGPAAVKYGPNTVGGALNLLTRQVPDQRSASIDIAGGSDMYGKLHAWAGDRTEHTGFLVEGVKLRTDGFKELDGGGDTGFDKNSIMGKALVEGELGDALHRVDAKAAYSDEVSDETYTGLTDQDFEANPYRRYAGTQLDQMRWDHVQLELRHRLTVPGSFALTTTLYRHDFSRDWGKLSGFAGQRNLAALLASPDAGANAVYYSVLSGQADSASTAEQLILGTNERDFVAEGAQLNGTAEREWLGWNHNFDLGLRFHHDEVDRFHYEENYWMRDGQMVPVGGPISVTKFATGAADAWAAYARDRAKLGNWTLTAGLRTELIETSWTNHADPEDDSSDDMAVLIPGGGVVYQALPNLGLLVGVHKGFVPTAPGSAPQVEPEESINYEAGARYATELVTTEAIGFFSDYSNLIGTCTFSTGCTTEQIDEEFNGGRVHVYGLEAKAAAAPEADALRFPLALTYTLTRSEFQSSFSSSNPQWGDIMEGDELPDLPEHQVRANAGVATERWELSGAVRYTSEMRDVAGQGQPMETEATDAALVFDLAAHLRLGRWGETYLTVDNLLDDAYIVSRQPYGVRPGIPRRLTLGYKASF